MNANKKVKNAIVLGANIEATGIQIRNRVVAFY